MGGCPAWAGHFWRALCLQGSTFQDPAAGTTSAYSQASHDAWKRGRGIARALIGLHVLLEGGLAEEGL